MKGLFLKMRYRRLSAALCVLALSIPAISAAQSRAREQHSDRVNTAAPADANQAELSARIANTEKVRSSGDPAAIAAANRLLIASALRAMGRLRQLEGAPAQSAALFQASLGLEDLEAVYPELARSTLMAGQVDKAIAEAERVLHRDPNNVEAILVMASALTHKQEYAKAAGYYAHAARLQPSMRTMYSLAICWLSTGTPQGRERGNQVFEQMKAMAGDSGSLHVLMGRAYRDAGMMPQSIEQFKKAIAMDTTTPHAHYFLGLADLSQNEWNWTAEAQSEFQKEAEYHPQDYLANYMLGFLASSRRNYALADKYLKIAASLNPNLPEPFLYLGLNAFAQGDNKEAEQMLEKAVQLTGDEEARANYQIRRAYVDLARLLAREGREKEADVFSAKARALENKTMVDSQQRTTALMISEGAKVDDLAAVMPLSKQNQSEPVPVADENVDPAARVDLSAMDNSTLTPDQRAGAIKEEAALRPILGQSYSDLATAEAMQRKYPEALQNYESAEKWDDTISGLYKNLGLAAYRGANYAEAARGLAKAVAANPETPALRAMLGMSYFQLQRYGDAATAFYPLGEAGMQDAAVGYAWAYSLMKDGDLKHATEVLTAYQARPLPNAALLLVGQLWAQIGDYDRATATMRQILASDPSFRRAHYTIGLADIQAQKWADARAELNAELKIEPGDADTLYNLGIVDAQESNNPDAERLFEQVIAKQPDNADAQYELGKLLMDGGKPQQALPHLEIAAKVSPDKAYVHYQLQAAYRKLSRTADADRELALYQQLKAKSRAEAQAVVNQTLQQKP